MGLLETTYLKEEKGSDSGCEPPAWRRAVQFAQVAIGNERAESENTWLEGILASDLNHHLDRNKNITRKGRKHLEK